MGDVLLACLGVIIGGAITWLVARQYYVKATKDLQEEAAKLRQRTDWVLYALFNKDAVLSPTLDKSGNLIGITVSATGTAGGTSFASARTLSVKGEAN